MSIKNKLLGLKPRVTKLSIDADLDIYIKVMSGSERYVFEKQAQDETNNENGLVSVAFLVVCDEDGQRLFTNESDKAELEKMPADVLYKIFNAAIKLNHIGAADASDDVKP